MSTVTVVEWWLIRQNDQGCRTRIITKEKTPMQFMMLMIPNVYRGNKKLDPRLCARPKES